MFSSLFKTLENFQRTKAIIASKEREYVRSQQLDRLPPGSTILEEMNSLFWIVEVQGNTYLAQWITSEYPSRWEFVPYKAHEKVQSESVPENCPR